MVDKTSGDEVYDLIADACGVEIADRFFFIFAGSSISLPENPENIMTNNAVVMAMGVDIAVQIATAVGSYRGMLPAGSFSKLSAVRADLLSQTASMLIAKVPVAQIARQLKITERTVWRHKKALRARHKVRAVKQLRQGAHPDGIVASTVLSRDEVHQLRAIVLAEKARRLGAAE